MAPPAAQAQLLLSNHPSPSPPHRRRLLPLLRRPLPPRPHTCAIRHHHHLHDKWASSFPRLRHALRPPGAGAAAVAIAPGDHWGNWAFLLSAAAFGTWAEENTSWGAALSGALVSILAGLAATAVGLVTPGAPAHDAVMEYLLPAAVPMLLLGADLRRVVRTTGDLLKAFLLGSVATVIGTTVAYLLIPMRSLGQDSWKIAAALMGSYIGGAVNYVAISEALGLTPSVLAAGVAADNLIMALYFMALFSLASDIPAEPETATAGPQKDGEPDEVGGGRLSVLNGGAAIALSFIICKAGSAMAARLGLQGGTLPCVTALVVFLATAFPGPLGGRKASPWRSSSCSSSLPSSGSTATSSTPSPGRPASSPSRSCRCPSTSPSCSWSAGSWGSRGSRCSSPPTPTSAGLPPRPPWPRPKAGPRLSCPESSLAFSGSPLQRFLASDMACSCSEESAAELNMNDVERSEICRTLARTMLASQSFAGSKFKRGFARVLKLSF